MKALLLVTVLSVLAPACRTIAPVRWPVAAPIVPMGTSRVIRPRAHNIILYPAHGHQNPKSQISDSEG